MVMSTNQKFLRLRYILPPLLLLAVGYSITESDLFRHYLSNPDALKQFVLGFGLLAPLAVIILQAFQTTISIIPSQLTTIVSGFVFGPVLGLVYSLIGAMLGSSLVFALSRKYGKRLALRLHLFDKKDIVHFHLFFKRKKVWALFLARVLPLFPNDLISFAAALTGMRFRDFTFFSTLGFVFQMLILTYLGSELSQGRVSMPLIVITILVIILLIIFLFKKQIKLLLIKDLRSLEKEGRTIEDEFRKIKSP